MIDFMNATGDSFVDIYLRLSRDDKRKGISVSIENQNKILNKFLIDHGYSLRYCFIDDGESGYSFDRPSFDQVKKKIQSGEIKRLLIKDMSRLGRHNAKALLFMEEAKDDGCEVIALDDQYSNFQDNDATIGIKTWHNELYVKEASKKVKNVIHLKQEEGEWLPSVPYGYYKVSKIEVSIDPETAPIVQRVFTMYQNGFGLLTIARTFTDEHIPTPSRYQHEQRIRKGLEDNSHVSDRWNDQCIRRILTNEFYIGTLIQHQGECKKIRGKYKTLPKDQWIYFKQHHAAIVEETTFHTCQDILSKKKRPLYKKGKKQEHLFHGFITCAKCKAYYKPHQTPKDKQTGNTHYYCSTYLSQGKNCCKSNSINSFDLIEAVTAYLKHVRDTHKTYLSVLPASLTTNAVNSYDHKILKIKTRMKNMQDEITNITQLRIQESHRHDPFMQGTYQSLIDDKLKQMHTMENEMKVLQEQKASLIDDCSGWSNGLDVINDIIERQNFTKEELSILFYGIIVDDQRVITFKCKGNND